MMLQTPNPVLGPVCASHGRESDDSYPRVVIRLSAKLRVIECRDGIQWILQRCKGGQWRGFSFHRDREVLIARCGPISSDALALLRALPPFHLGGAA